MLWQWSTLQEKGTPRARVRSRGCRACLRNCKSPIVARWHRREGKRSRRWGQRGKGGTKIVRDLPDLRTLVFLLSQMEATRGFCKEDWYDLISMWLSMLTGSSWLLYSKYTGMREWGEKQRDQAPPRWWTLKPSVPVTNSLLLRSQISVVSVFWLDPNWYTRVS